MVWIVTLLATIAMALAIVGALIIRQNVVRPLADITRVLADCKISIEAMVQREPGEGESQVDIVMLTHRALEKNVDQATARIERLDTVTGNIVRLRMEELL